MTIRSGSQSIDGQRPRAAASRRLLAIYAVLTLGTLITFSGVAQNGFIDYDDDLMILEDQVSNGLTLNGMKFAWTGPHVGNWHPLTTLSHQLDCQLFGTERPGLHHLVNLGLHIISVLVLFEALRRMTRNLWPSAVVAALFAIHPLRVESVAWASERKDVLSGLFWMLTLLAYVGYARHGGVVRYLVVCGLFCLGLLSKPMLVTLPFVLLLLDWWPLRRWSPPRLALHQEGRDPKFPQQKAARVFLEKLPLLAPAAAVAWATTQAHRAQGVYHASLAELSIPWRLTNAVVAYGFYLGKTLWPSGLAIHYPHPGLAKDATIDPWILPAIGMTGLLLTITACVILGARRQPYLTVGWLWYVGTLVPVIGIVQVGEQAYADRYTYVPMIGIYIAIAWAGAAIIGRWPRARFPLAVVGGLWLVLLVMQTWRQVHRWHDSQTLFEHTLRVTDGNRAIQNNLGNALRNKGHIDKAIEHYREALRLSPTFADAHTNLGIALQSQGQFAEALTHYQQAVQLKPDSADAHYNYGVALARQNEFQEAAEQFQRALVLKPEFAAAHSNLGLAFQRQRRFDDSLRSLQEAIRLKPDSAKAHFDIASVLMDMGRYDTAVEHCQRALRLKPDNVDILINLGIALEGLGQPREAIKQYERVLLIKKDNVSALNNLAWFLATHAPEEGGDPKRAVELSDRACRDGGLNNAAMLGTLAAAYASDHRFAEAIATSNKAIDMAQRSKQVELAEKLKGQLEYYKTGKPYRRSALGS